MAMAVRVAAGLVVALLLAGDASAATLALYNRCAETVWPGIQPSAGKELLARGGFQLAPNRATSIRLPARLVRPRLGPPGLQLRRRGARPLGHGRLRRGALLQRGRRRAAGHAGGDHPRVHPGRAGLLRREPRRRLQHPHRHDPVPRLRRQLRPRGVHQRPQPRCPAGLAVRGGGGDNRVVGCRSACAAYGAPQYCCTGQFGSPQQCKPTAYSRLFKTACPKAYSYAYDDPTSILTCSAGASYIVTFCPHRR
ncbi:hypothetical protein OsJ_22450 [Oryza sativa Japonica Group]|uniref:Thaumatin-like protein n=1 Tax=Oryza sativa subsp. japonica TaxID=39947 RepID=B9FQM2_ORYSJ|nr:hypothetical protein OsJ_22450 [Oryza sativa Japonica Group]